MKYRYHQIVVVIIIIIIIIIIAKPCGPLRHSTVATVDTGVQ